MIDSVVFCFTSPDADAAENECESKGDQAPAGTQSSILILGGEEHTLQRHEWDDPGAILIDVWERIAMFLEVSSVVATNFSQAGELFHQYALFYRGTDSKGDLVTGCRSVVVEPVDCTDDCEEGLKIEYSWKAASERLIDWSGFTLSCSPDAVACDETEDGMMEVLIRGSEWIQQDVVATEPPNFESFGVRAVDTSRPTKNGEPYIVAYQPPNRHCYDKAASAVRRVRVVCPEGFFTCEGDDSAFCTTLPTCGLEPDEDTFPSNRESLETKLPYIELRGASIVEVAQWTPYVLCPMCMEEDFDIPFPCEKGAIAWDDLDGNLGNRIKVCKGTKEDGGSLLYDQGLAGCEFDTSRPGTYEIVFQVKNSAGREASKTRLLRVLPVCAEGEYVCDDGLSCSGTGCPPVFPTPPPLEQPSLPLKTYTMELIERGDVSSVTRIPKGTNFSRCESDMSNTQLCEPGVSIFPADNAYKVFVCPTMECQQNNAPCSLHSFDRHGLGSCELNTSTVGSVLEIVFMAKSDSESLPPMFATRYLDIIPACPSGYSMCDNECTPLSCDILSGTLNGASPNITILSGAKRVVVPFGMLLTGWNLPCDDNGEECSVSAWDAEDGDLTGAVECRGVDGSCHPTMIFAGLCSPGNYTFSCTVTDSDGNAATPRSFDALVIETGVISMYFTASGQQQVAALYQAKRNNGTLLRSFLVENLVTSLSKVDGSADSFMRLNPEDVSLTITSKDNNATLGMKTGLLRGQSWIASIPLVNGTLSSYAYDGFTAFSTKVQEIELEYNEQHREGLSERKTRRLQSTSREADFVILLGGASPDLEAQTVLDVQGLLGFNVSSSKVEVMGAPRTLNLETLKNIINSIRNDQEDIDLAMTRMKSILKTAPTGTEEIRKGVFDWMISALKLFQEAQGGLMQMDFFDGGLGDFDVAGTGFGLTAFFNEQAQAPQVSSVEILLTFCVFHCLRENTYYDSACASIGVI
ncbi:hypothetical protein BSKO_10341 [Bryopsis sp. KO-2023]|nr:hypothetical protein BSKO_10341 [Bryopsis sp. KO-2023]